MTNPQHQVLLVTGPASSGKSEWAETLATKMNQAVIYVATSVADPQDPQWQEKIKKHALRRPQSWQLLEVPVDLAATIQAAQADNCLLIESLGTWVANCLEQPEPNWEQSVENLIASLQQTPATIILVAEETGWGVVPAYQTGRIFRDRLGNLSRKVGAIADTVYLVTGGYILNLTTLGMPLPQDKSDL